MGLSWDDALPDDKKCAEADLENCLVSGCIAPILKKLSRGTPNSARVVSQRDCALRACKHPTLLAVHAHVPCSFASGAPYMTSSVMLSTGRSVQNVVGLLKHRARTEIVQLEQELLAVLDNMEEEAALNSTAMQRGHDHSVDGTENQVALCTV